MKSAFPRLCRLVGVGLIGWVGGAHAAEASSPFEVSAKLESQAEGMHVRVTFHMPAGHYLYADTVHIEAIPPAEMTLRAGPRPTRILDKHSGEELEVFKHSPEWLYRLVAFPEALELEVSFQGCNELVCFFPETRRIAVSARGAVAPALPRPGEPAKKDWKAAADRFRVSGRTVGFQSRSAFLAFLDRAASGAGLEDPTVARWRRLGRLVTVLLILLGGAALNLTPCVLPLIPVNLAILGAGARAGSRWRGLALGGVYGLGMALAYGMLGLIVVLTGAQFGALNASPWFNAGIAVLFLVLALAMFDVIEIDLSRFQRAGGPIAEPRGRYAAALVLGAVAALLAGACVAPVLISVLLLAGTLYSRGQVVGLLLPFLLGLGMALPWPLAGAGLSFLPKPGPWMTRVRNLFGLLILLLALYYAFTAWRLFRPAMTEGVGAQGQVVNTAEGLAAALEEAADAGRPVLIDFWATWCKNCTAMEKTTLKELEVLARLTGYRVVKFQAEKPGAAPASDILNHFGVRGLPTYVVLNPRPPARPRASPHSEQ